MRTFEYYYGTLMGGAIGDAMGGFVESISYHDIVQQFGEEGIVSPLILPHQKMAHISDDTQLSLFTAEGLLRSVTRAKKREKPRSMEGTCICLFRAYLRWLYTQGMNTVAWKKKDYDGWLIKQGRLFAYRTPGLTCLTSLGRGVMGTLEKPLNDSNRCGSVIRVAPIGLFEPGERVFEMGCRSAAITHGGTEACLSAGYMAQLIFNLIEAMEIEEAIDKALSRLKQEKGSELLISKLEQAIKLAGEGEPGVEKIEALGVGFNAEEVLTMAIYAALSYKNDFEAALRLAVNHSGDSDSVAALTGNILGAYLGIDKINPEWIQDVELNDVIKQVAEDLFATYNEGEAWLLKYPAW